jgi:hypothetical protein
MEQRRAETMAERKQRYEELRVRAAEVGLELPETPPWEQAGMQPPQMPAPPAITMPEMPRMPGGRSGAMTPEERDDLRAQRYQVMRERAMQRGIELPETPPWKLMSDEERQTHREKMRNMTPEERRAMHETHWQEMRARAQEQGVEMPETPPWRQAEQRRQETKARWDSYREVLDAMTLEQKEAVQAVFGQGQRQLSAPGMGHRMPPGMPMQAPFGQQDQGLPSGPGIPGYGYGPQGTDPSMYNRGPAAPWTGGRQPMYPGPAQGQ